MSVARKNKNFDSVACRRDHFQPKKFSNFSKQCYWLVVADSTVSAEQGILLLLVMCHGRMRRPVHQHPVAPRKASLVHKGGGLVQLLAVRVRRSKRWRQFQQHVGKRVEFLIELPKVLSFVLQHRRLVRIPKLFGGDSQQVRATVLGLQLQLHNFPMILLHHLAAALACQMLYDFVQLQSEIEIPKHKRWCGRLVHMRPVQNMQQRVVAAVRKNCRCLQSINIARVMKQVNVHKVHSTAIQLHAHKLKALAGPGHDIRVISKALLRHQRTGIAVEKHRLCLGQGDKGLRFKVEQLHVPQAGMKEINVAQSRERLFFLEIGIDKCYKAGVGRQILAQ
eukprot:m.226142 g.226142  ORF g.226142 m.226142 type:complete len:336 (+) comp22356_c0_seq4:2854-3861(+)